MKTSSREIEKDSIATAHSDDLLNVEELRIFFRTRSEPIRAVDGVSFAVRRAETTALVGESGCGKSVSALALARLVAPPGFIAGGRVMFAGRDVSAMNGKALRRLRGAELSYVFQEPSTSLNPVFRVGYQVAESIRLHRGGAPVRRDVADLFKRVGLPENRTRSYPHELSGGMQQRVMIAMALACNPKLLVADEPTTALDVTIQAQILDLLARLQRDTGMGMLVITHNFGIVAGLAQRVYVMYAGRIIEYAPTEELLTRPLHPYTQGLLKAVPRLAANAQRISGIPGSVPNPARPPTGCKFHPRCPEARERCRVEEPDFSDAGNNVASGVPGDMKHGVKCHFWK